jgi:hypothetical protein
VVVAGASGYEPASKPVRVWPGHPAVVNFLLWPADDPAVAAEE